MSGIVNNYKWKSEEIHRLINLIEVNPCLWNVVSTEFHDRLKREKAVSDIAVTLKTSKEEVKKKIHSLRTQYTNERSKMRKLKTGTGAKDRYKTKWEFYNNLHFMFQHSSKNEAVDSMNIINSDLDNGEMEDSGTQYESSFDENDDNTTKTIGNGSQSVPDEPLSPLSVPSPLSSISSDSQTPQSLSRKKKKTSQQSSIDLQEQAAINRCLAVLNSNQMDEYTIFGENVANELRLLKDVEDVQFTLKTAIQKSILDANAAAHAARKSMVQSVPVALSVITDPPVPVPQDLYSSICIDESNGITYTLLQTPEQFGMQNTNK